MVLTKKWLYSQSTDGDVSQEDFQLVEEDITFDLKNGELLCEALFLSVDPYMRGRQREIGKVPFGEQVARVTGSQNDHFPVGTLVLGYFGWKTHTVTDTSQVRPLPLLGDLPPSCALGVMGMTGMTAYFGVNDILKPEPGETFVVNAAAGAVGSTAGQLAKLKGCKVIGFTGSDDKCHWLTEELKFDHVFNYKRINVEEALSSAVPEGVDCYFDNVGGDMTNTVLHRMKVKGRVAICGCIATAQLGQNQPTGPYPYFQIIKNILKVQGFGGLRYKDRWPQAQQEMLQLISEGKVKYRETITDGFENMVHAFLGLFKGNNMGKAIIKMR